MKIGFAKADITVYQPGMAMCGWAQSYNVSQGVAEPLWARAMVVDTGANAPLVYVCVDLCYVSHLLRQTVLDRLGAQHPELGVDAPSFMLTATHTHSGPSGFHESYFYNIPNLGFSQGVLDGLAHGIVEAIGAAYAARVPGRLSLTTGQIPLDQPVAFNRAWQPYNQNPEVQRVRFADRHRAVDRTVVVLRANSAGGDLIGALSWFAVHGTSVHAEQTQLHPDNKGLAAEMFLERQGVIGIFAQGAPGDVSPNFRWSRKRGKMIGASDDDFESARFNAELQTQAVSEQLSQDGTPVQGAFWSALRYVNFHGAPVDPRFCAGRAGVTTTGATLGMAMAHGTAEGPGPMFRVQWINAILRGLRRLGGREDPKWPLLNGWRGPQARLAGVFPMHHPLVPGWTDPTVAHLKATAREGRLGSVSLMPQELPLQVWRLGPLAVVALPAEPTTTVARRIAADMLELLGPVGVERVVVNGYANQFSGYLTTPEEYRLQQYEGAYTLFGPHTLGAYRTALVGLVQDVLAQRYRRDDLGAVPAPIPEGELEQRSFSADPRPVVTPARPQPAREAS